MVLFSGEPWHYEHPDTSCDGTFLNAAGVRLMPGAPPSRFGTEAQQLHEGVEEALQPALVGHALLHHLLLAGVLSCLLNAVRLLGKQQVTAEATCNQQHNSTRGFKRFGNCYRAGSGVTCGC